jgi:hypothetical protein
MAARVPRERHGVNQGVDMPVSTRHGFCQSRAALRPAAEPAHIGFQSGFIHKNKSLWIDAGLSGAPIGSR